jgi:hypothetical protein
MEWSSFPHSPHPGGGPLGGGTPEKVVFAYHERTMHHPRRYAASAPTMDWASQPDPFRRYDGAPLVRLPLLGVGPPPAFWKLYVPGAVAPQPLTKDSLSTFFRYALSLTAWKKFRGTAWALRANPSSGNLHPTEGYAVLPQLEGVADGPAVHHYAPKEHGLERRADLDTAAWSALLVGFLPGSFLVGLSSVPWREAWKYGERAFATASTTPGTLWRHCGSLPPRSVGRCSFSMASVTRTSANCLGSTATLISPVRSANFRNWLPS